MTPRQRLLAALKGEKVDRIPWSPNLAYWTSFQSKEIMEMCEVELLESMGADPLIRGHHPNPPRDKEWSHLRSYDTVYHNCSIENVVDGNTRTMHIKTKIGDLKAVYVLSPEGATWFLCEHPIKTQDDYKIVKYFFDNMELIPNFKDFDDAAALYGERALIVAMLAPEINVKSSFQSLVEFWVGTEELAYAVEDYPEEVDMVVEAMRKVNRRAAEISADSNAEAFITWEDTSTTNISPAYYERYILPEINEWCTILQAKGKMYIQHACGHLAGLMDLMGSSKINGIESISPPPTGNITMKDARAALPADKFLIGGIEPTVLLNSNMEELEAYTRELLRDMEGYPFILANSDSCPPGVDFEKFVMVSKLVKGEI